MENKKVRGATSLTYNGITFRSKLEVILYKVLEENNLNPLYEPEKFHIWTGFKPTVPFYIKDKKTKSIKLEDTKIIDITYCPDIEFIYGNYIVYVEVKPDYCNDVYPYKRKLFRKYLEDKVNSGNCDYKPIFIQVGTKKNLLEFLSILKTKYNEETTRVVYTND